MILGIGIDSVAIGRFVTWHQHPKRVARIFSPEEITYCTSVPAKSAERFALRFAAREAVYKALCTAGLSCPPFLTLCKNIRVSTRGPLTIKLLSALNTPQDIQVLASGTHAENLATAIVIITKNTL